MHTTCQPTIGSRKGPSRMVIGRFAPSPTGPLHAGSLVAATASWLDVRAARGTWLVRIEDLDRPREVAGAAEAILSALVAHGFRWDGDVVRQSGRHALYQRAFDTLVARGAVYPCGCSRREIETGASGSGADEQAAIYRGRCRDGLDGRAARAWRMRVPDGPAVFVDRAAGDVTQDLAREVGDFVIRRADGPWAYQLAVVVDDAAQGVTDVVRGADLLDSTPRQRLLQQALGLPRPRTLHVPLVLDAASGAKLSKSRGAHPLDDARPLPALHDAARHLGLEVPPSESVAAFWERATEAWARRWPLVDA